MRRLIGAALLLAAVAAAPQALQAQQIVRHAPFIASLSNNTPLQFGMAPTDAARALDTPLAYVRGRRGDETLLAIRAYGGSGFFERRNRLYLQFRQGRLTGWKGDWGSDWLAQ
ncbi:hypothetical protein [Rhodopseudomonas sp. P2A-2r]|uniref:hypothetical protein n=1 Tax=unclassified Rhodopseudomonas TaxID=2638247 RepID=UPI0022341AA0|nr:hypothetical protein [Rhodopseudomonas sp. P2A-2r]UZE49297.1 hypothetical protein ONR75_32305 [Rhodopseudomonas sp. P2A-2r]